MVRAAFPTQQGTSALSITSTSAKLRTWKLEPFEYNGGQCIGIGTAFQGEVSNADRQAVILIENMLSESSLKRDAEVLDAEDECPFKKKRLAFTNNDDIDWLKHEICDIEGCMKEMAECLRGNVEYRLEELRLDIQEWS